MALVIYGRNCTNNVPEGFAMARVLQNLQLPLRQMLSWSLAAL